MWVLEFYRYTIIVIVLFICSSQLIAQRQYATNSVLSKGNWYKIGVIKEGVYKIDVNFLKSIGVNVTNLNSLSIKLYGNGGGMLGESTNAPKIDDLSEDAIEVNDGGDGIFNNTDYFLFYSAGPDKWLYDSSQHRFYHQKNLYSDTCYYFITIDSNGRRINELDNLSKPFNKSITTYNERVFHENDYVNLLNSGKEWYGEYFNSQNNSQSFSINASNIDYTIAASINTSLVSRTIGSSSVFSVLVNNQKVQNIVFNDVTGNLIDQYALKIKSSNTFANTAYNLNVSIQFNPGNSLAQGWLDWFEVFFRRGLWMDNSQMGFRDISSIGASYIKYNISNADNTTEIWDVTDEIHPVKQKTSISGSQLFFINNTDSLKEYFAFKSSAYQTPIFISKIDNQNLHNIQSVDYLIITPKSFITSAQSLANFHNSYYGYTDMIAPVEQIYNEFGGGNASPAAIRDFIKMYFDKSLINAKQLKYVLLFGLGSFDPKNRIMINKNFIPCYESDSSLNILSSYTSDDFYGILKDGENMNDSASIQLDVAVGRLPVRTLDEANNVVNKITAYHSHNSFGSWRNNISFLADNGEYNFFFNNAEQLTSDVIKNNITLNPNKIYNDAYPKKITNGIETFPSVNSVIVNSINNGNLICNYNGHGNYQQLSGAAIFTNNEFQKLSNQYKLPLFIVSTCDFLPIDDPTKSSLGSNLISANKYGGIALLTSSRLADAQGSMILNESFLNSLLTKQNINSLSIGDAFMIAKNYSNIINTDFINTRKYALIGDPGIQLAIPKYSLVVDSVNNQVISNQDSLQQYNKYLISGKVLDNNNQLVNSFNGVLYPTLYDVPIVQKTLGNDSASIVSLFNILNNKLFIGKDTVINGLFHFQFTMPVSSDTVKNLKRYKLSLYANNDKSDASGFDTSFINASIKRQLSNISPPTITAYLNDFNFKEGQTVDANPLLLLRLSDSLGINIRNDSSHHDIRAYIDSDSLNSFILNDYFIYDINSFQIGTVVFPISGLSVGKHSLTASAWDIAGKYAETTIEFIVSDVNGIQIVKFINYPNPFSSNTNFYFEINNENGNVDISISIYSITGNLVKTLQQKSVTSNTMTISWDGKGNNSSFLNRGIYIAKLSLINEQKTIVTKGLKILIN